MRNHLLLHDDVGFFDQFGGGLGCDVVKHVSDGAQSVQAAAERQVIVMELVAGCDRKGTRAAAVRGSQRPQRVEDDGDVDHLLNQSRRHWFEPTEHGCNHGDTRQTHAGDNALHRNPARALGDDQSFSDAIKPVGNDHHVRRLRRGAGTTRAHGYADIRRRKRRGIVDAVADHGGRIKPLLGAHRIDFVGRHAVGEHRVKIERRPNRLRGRSMIAGHHDDAGDAGCPQHADRMRRLGT